MNKKNWPKAWRNAEADILRKLKKKGINLYKTHGSQAPKLPVLGW